MPACSQELDILKESKDNDLDCDEYKPEELSDIKKWWGKELFLIRDGVSSMDCFQGDVGSCVVISGIQALAHKPELIEKLLVSQDPYDYPTISQGVVVVKNLVEDG